MSDFENGSIFSTLWDYIKDVFQGVRSIYGSLVTSLPYLLNVNSGDLRKEVTEQYPDPVSSRTSDDLPPRTRGLLVNDIEKCTGCRECEFVCPLGCIEVETEEVPDSSKIWVSVYNIDFAKCIFCGLCAESCPPGSLTHSKKFERAVTSAENLITEFGLGQITQEQRDKWLLMKQVHEEENA